MTDLSDMKSIFDIRRSADVTIVWDFDGLICKNNSGNYSEAPPIEESIKQINLMFDLGYNIVICTARYGQRHPDKQYQYGFLEATEWLKKHKVKYNELRMGKPAGDLYLDDKGCRVDPKNPDDWSTVWKLIHDLHYKNQYGQYLRENQ